MRRYLRGGKGRYDIGGRECGDIYYLTHIIISVLRFLFFIVALQLVSWAPEAA